jgi:hypothetical protein
MNTLCKPVHVSLGAYGRIPFREAVAMAVHATPVEPLLGKLSSQALQLCPQNTGTLTCEVAASLRESFPQVKWRLHANVKNRFGEGRLDLSAWPLRKNYFRELAVISKSFDAPMYSAHAGKRSEASLHQVIAYSIEMTEVFGIPVAIEGHYPTIQGMWLFDSWKEYKALLESDAYYALDLSHLNILAHQSQCVEWLLVQELLNCERCLEVHLSANDGIRDLHQPLEHLPWWWSLLPRANPNATFFSEGRVSR